MIVHIAFQGGTHGHFLRYFLDKFSTLTPPITDDLSHPGKADSKTSREASADKVECPDSGAVFSKQLHGMAFSLTFLTLFFIL